MVVAAFGWFRWAWTVWIVGGALLWLFVAMVAHAQPRPMVECQIGDFVRPTSDVVCRAWMRGAAQMYRAGRLPDGTRQPECKREILRTLGYADISPKTAQGAVLEEDAIVACGAILQGLVDEYAYSQAPH
jgi:hypothetical protein